jgi:hypothetical protein
MIRARFKLIGSGDDYRPITWPIKHPYWCTGYDSFGNPILVAYADDQAEIERLWPEAEDIDFVEVTEYQFTDRFPKPDWFKS